jgi:hypothetical protein
MLISQEGHIKLTDFGLSCQGSVLRQQEGSEEQQQPPLMPPGFMADFISDSGNTTPTALPAPLMQQQQMEKGWVRMPQQLMEGRLGDGSENGGEPASCCNSVNMDIDEQAEVTVLPAPASEDCSISFAFQQQDTAAFGTSARPCSQWETSTSNALSLEFEEHTNTDSTWVRKGARDAQEGLPKCEGRDGTAVSNRISDGSSLMGSSPVHQGQLGTLESRRGSTGSMHTEAKHPGGENAAQQRFGVSAGCAPAAQSSRQPARAAAAATAAARVVVEAAAAAVSRSTSEGGNCSAIKDCHVQSNKKQQHNLWLGAEACLVSQRPGKGSMCAWEDSHALEGSPFRQPARLGLEEALRGRGPQGGGCTPMDVMTPQGRASFTGKLNIPQLQHKNSAQFWRGHQVFQGPFTSWQQVVAL